MSNELKAHTHIDYSLHDLVNMKFYLAADVDALLAEKDKEIESLKASHYAEMVDAGMRERRLRRALWLARVYRAISMNCVDMYYKYKEKHPFTINQSFDEWVLIWQVVERKCRAMAERYMEGEA